MAIRHPAAGLGRKTWSNLNLGDLSAQRRPSTDC